MTAATPMLTQFNAGELSPLMIGRADTSFYGKGCRTMRNFIPCPQGPAKRRGGTRYLGHGKYQGGGQDALPVLLQPFVRSQTESYVVEVSTKLRFWYNGALVESSPGNALEVSTPYDFDDLFNADGTARIQITQSADVMYFSHPEFPVYKLSHFSATNWTFAAAAFTDGPWLPENTNDTITMTVSATTGSITIASSVGVFDSDCVGQLVRVYQNDVSLLKAWYPGQRTTSGNLAVNDLRRSGTNTYKCKSITAGSTPGTIDWVETGSDTLFTTNGDQWDGPQDVVPNPATSGHYYGRGVQWTYQDSGYGVAVITAYTNSSHVTATVLRQFPASLVSSLPSNRWQLGAWAPYLGYPSLCCFFRERLCFGGGIYVWMSVAGDFENFADQTNGVIANDNAITIQVLSDSVNTLKWMAPSDTLLVGTTGSEHLIGQNTLNEPFGPENYATKKQSAYGGRSIPPIRVGGSSYFVTRTGRFVREFEYAIESDSFESHDATMPSENITVGGVCAMQWASNPDTVIWMVLGSANESGATLIGFTVNKDQEVKAWHNHPLGGDGIVKSIAVVPSIAGDYDELHLVVMRDVSGLTTCCIERLEQPWRRGTDDQADAFYVDAGGTYDGAPTTTITGLDHLNGYEVAVFADGQPKASKTVSGGSITLDEPASVVQAGLAYDAILQPMRIEAGGSGGPSQGKIKRINKVVWRFVDSLGGQYGRDVFDGSPLDELSYSDAPNPVSEDTTFYTGDTLILAWPGGYEQEGYIGYINSQPLPVTICGIMPSEVTYEGWG